MRTKKLIYLFVSALFAFVLTGCSEAGEMDVDELSRVDLETVQADGTYQEAGMITDEKTLKKLGKILKQVKWQRDTEAKLTRSEDIKATLFFTEDKDMPERLFEYRIWFNENEQTAMIISSDENEGIGTLETDAEELKNLLFQQQ